MSSLGNVAEESGAGSMAGVGPRAVTTWQTFYWCVRRELWEYPSVYVAPLAVAGVYLFAFLIRSVVRLPSDMRAALVDAAKMKHLAGSYEFAAAVCLLAAMVVQIYYCLDSMQSERRDRSILFWKSMPVSDLMTVASKAAIPFAILPAVGFAIVLMTGFVMLVVSSLILAVNGLSPVPLWTQLSLVKDTVGLLYHILTVHILWYAPLYAWLMFASAWSKRASLLWAVLPWFAVGIFEKIVFNTAYFAHWIQMRFAGGMNDPASKGAMGLGTEAYEAAWQFWTSPGLWLGLLVAAGLLAAIVRIRRYREAS